MNFRPMKNNVVYWACNKTDHIGKYCKSKNNASVDKDKSNEKGKAEIEEIKEKHEKMWVRKDDSIGDNRSAHEFDAGSSTGN